MTMPDDELLQRLQGLFNRLKDFPEAGRCEHGVHLKPAAYVAFLELRQLIEKDLLPLLHQVEAERR